MLAMVGLCEVEVKTFGPVQFHAVTFVPAPVKVNVLPTQIGLGAAEAVTLVGTVQPMQPKATQVEEGASYASKHRVVVLKMSSALAGETILALRCAVVMRGTRNPAVVSTRSKIELLSGTTRVLLMETAWENP